MNIREGIRRIGIVLGGVGAVCGLLVASPIILGDVQDAWTHHEFMNLASSLAVRRKLDKLDWFERNAPTDSKGSITVDVGEGVVARVHLAQEIFSFTPEQEVAVRELDRRPKESMSPQQQAILAELDRRVAIRAYKVVTEGGTYIVHTAVPIPAAIDWVEKVDGTILCKDTELTFWRVILAVLAVFGLPLAGYFFPVGLARLVTWVVDGFGSTK